MIVFEHLPGSETESEGSNEMRAKFHTIRNNFSMLILLTLFLFFLGCGGGGDTDQTGVNEQPPEQEKPVASSLNKGLSEAELETYLKNQFASSVYPAFSFHPGGTGDSAGSGEGQPAQTNDDSGYSQTNNQETGVDEPDLVKSNGTHFFIAHENTVTISLVYPLEELNAVSEFEVQGFVNELHLYGDLLVVLYTPYEVQDNMDDQAQIAHEALMGALCWLPFNARTCILMVDVSDPAAPQKIQETRIDGWLNTSRRIDGKLHLVEQYVPQLPPLDLWFDEGEDNPEQIKQANLKKMENFTLDNLLPAYQTLDAGGQVIDQGRVVKAQDFYCPDQPQGGSIVTVVTFDLDDPQAPFKSTGIVADAHVVYASSQSLYLASTCWQYWMRTSDKQTQTVIHKFDLSGEDVAYIATGNAKGRILNQFSLGEHDNVLRIATTTGSPWGDEANSKNNVYCLKADQNKLVTIGTLEGLAPGEQLYAARFFGPRGYLVTAVQVDPLFTVDLSDPTAPRQLGELKVPGIATYIHPVDDHHIITVGGETTQTGRKVALSLFDVSDFSTPKLVDRELIGEGWSSSEAEYQHKAFTFWTEQNLLALPVSFFTGYEAANDDGFSGLYVYRVNFDGGENAFEHRGTLQTRNTWYGIRGLFIRDAVYAATGCAIYAAPIDDMENPAAPIQWCEETPIQE